MKHLAHVHAGPDVFEGRYAVSRLIEEDMRENDLGLAHSQLTNISKAIFTYPSESHGRLPTSPRRRYERYAGLELKQMSDIGLCQTVHVTVFERVDRCRLYKDRCIRVAALWMLPQYTQREM